MVSTIAGNLNDAWKDGVYLTSSFSGPSSLTVSPDGKFLLIGELSGRVRVLRLADSAWIACVVLCCVVLDHQAVS
jgi:hypothetical protein